MLNWYTRRRAVVGFLVGILGLEMSYSASAADGINHQVSPIRLGLVVARNTDAVEEPQLQSSRPYPLILYQEVFVSRSTKPKFFNGVEYLLIDDQFGIGFRSSDGSLTHRSLWVPSKRIAAYADMKPWQVCWPFSELHFVDGGAIEVNMTFDERGAGLAKQSADDTAGVSATTSHVRIFSTGDVIGVRDLAGSSQLFTFLYDQEAKRLTRPGEESGISSVLRACSK